MFPGLVCIQLKLVLLQRKDARSTCSHPSVGRCPTVWQMGPSPEVFVSEKQILLRTKCVEPPEYGRDNSWAITRSLRCQAWEVSFLWRQGNPNPEETKSPTTITQTKDFNLSITQRDRNDSQSQPIVPLIYIYGRFRIPHTYMTQLPEHRHRSPLPFPLLRSRFKKPNTRNGPTTCPPLVAYYDYVTTGITNQRA